MSAEFDDPFAVRIPEAYDIGRLVSHRVLTAGWQCRWCSNLLAHTADCAGLVCLNCDFDQPAPTTRPRLEPPL